MYKIFGIIHLHLLPYKEKKIQQIHTRTNKTTVKEVIFLWEMGKAAGKL